MPKLRSYKARVRFQPKQKLLWKFLRSARKPVIGYGGARGGGKSYALRNALLVRRIEYPGTNGYLFRKTYDQLQDNHIDPLFREHPHLRPYYNATNRVLSLPFPDPTNPGQTIYSRLYFRYLDRPQDVLNYQGRELEDIGIDEATQHPESVFDNLRASNRTSQTVHDGRGRLFVPSMVLTFNPGGVGHGWIKRKFIKRQFQSWEDPKDYMFIKALVYDNPKLVKADPGYLKRLESLPPDLRKAFLLGSFDVFEGQFFMEWMEQDATGQPYHVVPYYKPEPGWKRFISLDWGYYPGWFVAHWYAVLPNRRLYVYKELSLQRKTATEAAKEIIRMSGDDPIAYIMADPSIWIKGKGSQAPSIAEDMIAAGIPNRVLKKANNDRPNGWLQVRKYLSAAPDGLPWLQVAHTCHDLVRTLPDQVHDETNAEDLDTDGDDHWVDSLRYGVMSRPFRKSGGVLQDQFTTIQNYKRQTYEATPEGEMPLDNIREMIQQDLVASEGGLPGDPIRDYEKR